MTKRRSFSDLSGPRAPSEADIPALNRLFSDSFTDRYRRDGLIGVRVPQLNPDVWRYALRGAGDGAMLWLDDAGDLVAFNIVHHSGTEGWMGPLAVAPARQGSGLGQLIVQSAIDWLQGEGATTIGLETMPRTVDNIGFYGNMGFQPQYLTLTMTKRIGRSGPDGDFAVLKDLDAEARGDAVLKCAERLSQSASGYDFTREFELTSLLEIGDAILIERDHLRGFALWHFVPLAAETPTDDLRVLKLFADSDAILGELLTGLERCARDVGIPSVSVRCQTAHSAAYRTLMRRGYKVRWTDLRMTLQGFAESALPQGETLFSNWEI